MRRSAPLPFDLLSDAQAAKASAFSCKSRRVACRPKRVAWALRTRSDSRSSDKGAARCRWRAGVGRLRLGVLVLEGLGG